MAIVLGGAPASVAFTYQPVSGAFVAASLNVLPATFNFLLASSGTGANQCDLIYATTLTLAASTPQTLDLTALLDPIGLAVSFARVRYFARRNNATTDGWTVTEGGAASNPWTALWSGTHTLYPSSVGAGVNATNHGFTVDTAPGATGMVVDSTHKNLKFDPGSHAISVDVWLAGTSV